MHAKDLLLRNVIVGDTGKITEVVVSAGIIAKIGTALAAPDAESIDCRGGLLLPSFVDTHVHLDKTRIGAPQRIHHPVTATIAERIANEQRLRIELKHDPSVFGANLVRQLAAMMVAHDLKLAERELLLRLAGREESPRGGL